MANQSWKKPLAFLPSVGPLAGGSPPPGPPGLSRGHTDWVEDDEPMVPPIPRKRPYIPLIPQYDEQEIAPPVAPSLMQASRDWAVSGEYAQPSQVPLIPRTPILKGGMETDHDLVLNPQVLDHWGRPLKLPPRIAPQVTGPDGRQYSLLPRVDRSEIPLPNVPPADETGQIFPSMPTEQTAPELRGPMEELNPYQVMEQQARKQRQYDLANLALQGNRNAYGLLLQELDPPEIEDIFNKLSQIPADRSFQMPAQLPPELIPQVAPTPGADGLLPYAPIPQFPQQAPDANLMPPPSQPQQPPNIQDRISSTFGNMLDMYNAAQQGQLQTLGQRQRRSGWQKFVRDFVAPGVAAWRPESADSMAGIQKNMDAELAYTDKLRMNPRDYLGDLLRFGNLWQATDPASLKAQQAAAKLAETQAYHDSLQNKWSNDANWKNQKLNEVDKPRMESQNKRREVQNETDRAKIQQGWNRIRQAQEGLSYRGQDLMRKQSEALHRMATATTPQDKAKAAELVAQAKAETHKFAIAKAMTQTYTTSDGEEHLKYPELRGAYPQIAKEFGLLDEKKPGETEGQDDSDGFDLGREVQKAWGGMWNALGGQQAQPAAPSKPAPVSAPKAPKQSAPVANKPVQKPKLSKAQLVEQLKARGYKVGG